MYVRVFVIVVYRVVDGGDCEDGSCFGWWWVVIVLKLAFYVYLWLGKVIELYWCLFVKFGQK